MCAELWPGKPNLLGCTEYWWKSLCVGGCSKLLLYIAGHGGARQTSHGMTEEKTDERQSGLSMLEGANLVPHQPPELGRGSLQRRILRDLMFSDS